MSIIHNIIVACDCDFQHYHHQAFVWWHKLWPQLFCQRQMRTSLVNSDLFDVHKDICCNCPLYIPWDWEDKCQDSSDEIKEVMCSVMSAYLGFWNELMCWGWSIYQQYIHCAKCFAIDWILAKSLYLNLAVTEMQIRLFLSLFIFIYTFVSNCLFWYGLNIKSSGVIVNFPYLISSPFLLDIAHLLQLLKNVSAFVSCADCNGIFHQCSFFIKCIGMSWGG